MTQLLSCSSGLSLTALLAFLSTIRASYTSEDVRALSTVNGFTVNGRNLNSVIGNVVGGCDINNDGVSDLFISSLEGTGYIKVIYGRADGNFSNFDLMNSLSPEIGFTISGTDLNDQEGVSVACGDVNGDGFYDLITASPSATASGFAAAGVVHILYGVHNTPRADISWDLFISSASDGYQIFGVQASGNLGYSVAAIDDMNGNGIGEIIIGKCRCD
jgi:hypothetical protein